MKAARTLVMLTGAVMALSPNMARADHAWFHGRTGLPTLREAQNKIWMERGMVHLNVVGDTLEVTLDFRLSMPGPPLEKGPRTARIEFREDSYEGKHAGEPPMT